MIREIMFRGVPKNKDYFFYIPPEYYKYHNASNLIFVYGSFLKQNEKTFICWYYKDVYRKAEVIPETIGQYTGYKDIHKNNIYEGDIIKYPRYNGSDFILIGEVKFGEYKQDGSEGEYAPSICCGFYVEIKKCIYPDWCDPDDYGTFIQDYEKQNSIAEIINDSGNVEVIGNIYI